MTTLPEEFLARMKKMLGEEFPQFLTGYEKPRQAGLRANTLKIQPETLREQLPVCQDPIPWTFDGYYYPEEERPARHPYYHCGLYYLQEPSAMAPASLLPVNPGERVLDLCAAPGGKATKLGARLQGEGLLVANDPSSSRARALLRNIELFGITNALVTSEPPDRLARYFPEYFDKILVDAPCSGEGMFRKESAVASAWTPDKPAQCAKIQREIISRAVEMLAPGGLLLYSTCTFAPEENEEIISFLLQNHPEMELQEIDCPENFAHGRPEWGDGRPELDKTIRIWPHQVRGEGHFIALLQKRQTASAPDPHSHTAQRTSGRIPENKNGKANLPSEKQLAEAFLRDTSLALSGKYIEIRGEKAYRMPLLETDIRGIHFLRCGLFLGELKKNRFEPSQQLAMALGRHGYNSCLDLSPEDERIPRYLRGETLSVSAGETAHPRGWQLVCVDGYPLGWGKLVNGTLKNKYPAGWRT